MRPVLFRQNKMLFGDVMEVCQIFLLLQFVISHHCFPYLLKFPLELKPLTSARADVCNLLAKWPSSCGLPGGFLAFLKKQYKGKPKPALSGIQPINMENFLCIAEAWMKCRSIQKIPQVWLNCHFYQECWGESNSHFLAQDCWPGDRRAVVILTLSQYVC